MKKTVFFIMILAFLATGCKKDKSKSLNYSGANPIEMVLQEYYQIPASSEYDITYHASSDEPNKEVITVNGSGLIYAKNVGSGKVHMSNGYENVTVDVNVSLFQQPTFEFGCRTSRIRELYGSPYNSQYINDTVLLYQYVAQYGYSYACGEMDFFFDEGSYFESDVYIRPNVEYLLNLYLEENFDIDTELSNDTLDVYRYKLDNNIICGKFDSHNQWNEFCLFYIQLAQNTPEKSVANVLKRRPRSSKLRY